MQSINQKTISSVAHLGAFSKYFIPFGNFLIPIIIWVLHKEKPFSSGHAKRALNFQLSLFLYVSILITITLIGFLILRINLGQIDQFYISSGGDFVMNNHSPFFTSPFIIFIAIMLFLGLAIFLLEILCVINATFRAREGKIYKYPLCINFIKLAPEELKDIE
ncbi:DUF4870 domain-containing protein [Mesonia aestuariivivens]|uniref:DUF4870 domain-containing protein n=1 Tax=Mesonia aestuariivivens TaxID=2796128 RepID=A0ABS6VYF5_9FLAO|nr:DUF4870 domain-containing protein [Mesonia aestuariivivens]MBW2960615.1 DUF4870 domain-containing protein [Mesonia aestuariivivens]